MDLMIFIRKILLLKYFELVLMRMGFDTHCLFVYGLSVTVYMRKIQFVLSLYFYTTYNEFKFYYYAIWDILEFSRNTQLKIPSKYFQRSYRTTWNIFNTFVINDLLAVCGTSLLRRIRIAHIIIVRRSHREPNGRVCRV